MRGLPVQLMMGDPEKASKIMELWKRSGSGGALTGKGQPQRPAQPQKGEADRIGEVWDSLMSKAARGFGVPGADGIAWRTMPKSIRDAADYESGPIIGWHPADLTPEERMLVARLQQKAQDEMAAVEPQEEPNGGS